MTTTPMTNIEVEDRDHIAVVLDELGEEYGEWENKVEAKFLKRAAKIVRGDIKKPRDWKAVVKGLDDLATDYLADKDHWPSREYGRFLVAAREAVRKT